MLPKVNRVRKSAEFTKVFRSGKRSGNKYFVVYALTEKTEIEADLPKVGFVVGKKVGNSVVRHRVSRQLRHLFIPLLEQMVTSMVVVRAQPPAATADSKTLQIQLLKTLKKMDLLQADDFSETAEKAEQ